MSENSKTEKKRKLDVKSDVEDTDDASTTLGANPVLRYVWAMPNKNTFNIKPIFDLIDKHLDKLPNAVWIDPFANNNCFLHRVKFSNDINPIYPTTHHMDALQFLRQFDDNSIDGVLFDPPFTIHQINEVYSGYGDEKPIKQATAYYSEIDRICKKTAIVITLGFQGSGIPATLTRDRNLKKISTKRNTNFVKTEILVVPHGGGHNATIVCVDERKEITSAVK